MKALWAVEPFHQDKIRIKGIHNTLKQLVGSSENIEVDSSSRGLSPF
ncbi:MAG: hypothetical protein IPK68_23175 [Bdellovibrionales bacterium]|nr:hypothetical protein [Bdellovibrionales bacterium]